LLPVTWRAAAAVYAIFADLKITVEPRSELVRLAL
jgi:hypothetical protein